MRELSLVILIYNDGQIMPQFSNHLLLTAASHNMKKSQGITQTLSKK